MDCYGIELHGAGLFYDTIFSLSCMGMWQEKSDGFFFPHAMSLHFVAHSLFVADLRFASIDTFDFDILQDPLVYYS